MVLNQAHVEDFAPPHIAVVVADGLFELAVAQYAAPLLARLPPRLQAER